MAVQNTVRQEVGPRNRPLAGVKAHQKINSFKIYEALTP